jgi:hypothetical protein
MGNDQFWGEEWLEEARGAGDPVAGRGVATLPRAADEPHERVNLVRAMITGIKTWR